MIPITNNELLKRVTGQSVWKIEDADEDFITCWYVEQANDATVNYVIHTITVDQFVEMCKEWAKTEGFELTA